MTATPRVAAFTGAPLVEPPAAAFASAAAATLLFVGIGFPHTANVKRTSSQSTQCQESMPRGRFSFRLLECAEVRSSSRGGGLSGPVVVLVFVVVALLLPGGEVLLSVDGIDG